MKTLTHVVFITTDNTDVFNGTIIEEVPAWAKHLTLICGFSDYDSLIDLVVARDEYMRQSAPHVFAADNLLDIRRDSPSVVIPVTPAIEFPINMNWNVVTAGTGLAVAIYNS